MSNRAAFKRSAVFLLANTDQLHACRRGFKFHGRKFVIFPQGGIKLRHHVRVIAFSNNDMAIFKINLHAIQRRHDFLAIGGEECREIFSTPSTFKITLGARGKKLIPN